MAVVCKVYKAVSYTHLDVYKRQVQVLIKRNQVHLHITWGPDREILLRLYATLVYSKWIMDARCPLHSYPTQLSQMLQT